jgi:drug/metabolite transporter (DMT)-like permease
MFHWRARRYTQRGTNLSLTGFAMTARSLVISAPTPQPSAVVVGCLAATWLIWGSTYLAIKWALISLPPFFQMGTRFLVAGAVLMAWMRLVRRAAWPTPTQWRHAAVVGALMLGGGMGGTAYAEQSVESGLVVAFVAVIPIMIAALNAAWGLYPTRNETIGIVVGLIGVLMLTQGAGFSASPRGLLAIALGCFSWSIGSVLSQRMYALAPGGMGFASEMLGGGAALMLISVLAGEPAVVAANWPFTAKALLAWSYLVVFGSLIAFNSYMVLLERASAGLASSYSFVNPVIAMLLGVALAGEVVSDFEWLATAVILSGVVLLMMRRWR